MKIIFNPLSGKFEIIPAVDTSGFIEDAINDGVVDKAPSENAVFDALALKVSLSEKGANNGVATLDSGGKIPSSQLPAIAITDTFVVSSQAAMLALVAETGDIAIRTDINTSFVLQGSDPTVLGNWQELLSPGGGITSVNGQSGPSVVLTTSDINEGSNLYYTQARFDAALAGKSTSDLSEGSNLYYTDARARAAISANAPLSYDNVAGLLTLDLSPYALLNSPAFTGTPTAPTPATNDNSTAIATTAFVNAQGFLTSTGSIPTGEQDNASTVTSASTTFVTALTSTVTLTQTAQIHVTATATLTTTTAASVARVRTTINGVASRVIDISLSALATNYNPHVVQLSALLTPGTYTITFDISRLSGTGTVNYIEGTLVGFGLQGTNSNGITQLTGALQAGPGSGSQALTGVLPVANGGTHLSSTTINQILYSSANNVIAGLATANTGALVTSSTGVPSITAGATANRVLRTNGTTVSFAQVVLTTDVSGVLPAANGGTGHGNWTAKQVPFGTGTTLTGDPLLIYDSTNNQFTIGNGAGTGKLSSVVLPTDPNQALIAGNFYSRSTSKPCLQGQNENTLPTLSAINAGSAFGSWLNTNFNRGTLVARTQSLNGDAIFTLNSQGYTDVATSSGYVAIMQVVLSEDTTSSGNGGELVFGTTLNGTTTPVERLRLKNSGEAVFAQAVALANFTTANKLALTPSPGWTVYDSDLNQLSYYNGTTWVNL